METENMTLKEYYKELLNEAEPKNGDKKQIYIPPIYPDKPNEPTMKKDGRMIPLRWGETRPKKQSLRLGYYKPNKKPNKPISEATKTGIRRKARDMQIAAKYGMNNKFASNKYSMDALKQSLRDKAMKNKGLDPVGARYGESVYKKSVNEDLLNELGDTPAGRKALSSYISKRTKQIRGSMSQRIADIASSVMKGYDNIEYRDKAKLYTGNAELATLGLEQDLQRALERKARARTGRHRAIMTLYYPRRK
jgi:hypothetical protein